MGWLIALAVIVLLAMLPLGVSVRYDADGVLARALIGPAGVALYPRPKKEKAEEKKEKPKKKASGSGKAGGQAKEEKKGGKLTDFLPLLDTALKFLGDFRKKLRVKRLEIQLTMAGDDPCDLAVNYGRAWAAVGNLLPRLERVLKIKKRDIRVDCDFMAEHTRIYARADVTISLGGLLYLVVRYGVKALTQFMTIKKGGAEK